MRRASIGLSLLAILATVLEGSAAGATIIPITSGLHYRYAADSITGLSHGSRVDVWPDDLSGHGRDVAQADESRRPFYITDALNGLPVVRFTTANQFLHRPGDAFSSGTLFVVGMAASRQTGVFLSEYSTDASSGSNDRAWMLMARAGVDGDPVRDYNRWLTVPASGAQSNIDGPDGGALGWNLLAASFSNDGLGYNEFFVNGASIDSNATSPRTNGKANLVIGAYQAAGTPPAATFLRGDIAEIIAFDRVLSTVERRLVENALSAKYDLGIAALYRGHAAQYDFNVVGIGREADGAVVASPGKGASTGLVLLQHGELQIGQYLLAGDRNAVNGWVVDSLPSGVHRRWSRDWFLSPTGGLAGATLAFDFDDAGLAYSAGVEYDILYRADPLGAFERLNLAGMLDINQLVFVVADGLLREGSYTLGVVPEPGALVLLLAALATMLLMRRQRGANP